MQVEITKIVLRFKEGDFELTVAEARKVRDELNRLFDVESSDILQRIAKHVTPPPQQPQFVPYPVYTPPPIVISPGYIPPPQWEITCHSSGFDTGSQQAQLKINVEDLKQNPSNNL